MNGYGRLDQTLKQPRTEQLYSIDNKFYNSIIRTKYTLHFENDLTGKPADHKTYTGSLLLFNKGILAKAVFDIAELDNLVSQNDLK